MNQIFLWLLINMTQGRYPAVIDQFVSKEECIRVARVLKDLNEESKENDPRLVCVQVKVAR